MSDSMGKVVADNLRQWMTLNGLTSMRKAAPRLGLHHTYLCRLLKEQTNPTMATIEQLAQRMKIPAADLLREGGLNDKQAS